MEEIVVKIDGKEYKVKIEETEEGKIKVYVGKDVYEIETKSEVLSELEREEQKKQKGKHGENIITAPLPGTIVEVHAKEGKEVAEGDTLVKLVAIWMHKAANKAAAADGKCATPSPQAMAVPIMTGAMAAGNVLGRIAKIQGFIMF